MDQVYVHATGVETDANNSLEIDREDLDTIRNVYCRNYARIDEYCGEVNKQLTKIFDEGYDQGFNDGHAAARDADNAAEVSLYQEGYNVGYEEGFKVGKGDINYKPGFLQGIIDQIDEAVENTPTFYEEEDLNAFYSQIIDIMIEYENNRATNVTSDNAEYERGVDAVSTAVRKLVAPKDAGGLGTEIIQQLFHESDGLKVLQTLEMHQIIECINNYEDNQKNAAKDTMMDAILEFADKYGFDETSDTVMKFFKKETVAKVTENISDEV